MLVRFKIVLQLVSRITTSFLVCVAKLGLIGSFRCIWRLLQLTAVSGLCAVSSPLPR